jgi:hypothetical protein
MAQLKKADLIKILVEEYGYEKEDLKFDAEGKPYTNGKLKALIQAEKDDEEILEGNTKRVVARKSKIDDNVLIDIMSGLTGGLVYRSERTNTTWEFEEFGQSDTMTFGELVTLKNKYPRFLTEGWLIILDKQVQDEFKLTEMYENIITPDNIDEIFSIRDVEVLEKFIDSLPDGMKETFVNKAIEKYDKDELDSVAVVKLIQKKFNFSFEDNAPLGDIVSSVDTGVHNVIYVDKY